MDKNKPDSALDEIDFAIISFMQNDGRTSFTVRSNTLAVTVWKVRKRFNRLLDEKVITIVGRVDPGKVGFASYAQVAVYVRPAALKESVAQKIALMPEVSFLAGTFGDYDLEVDVMCCDNDHLVEFVNKISVIDGVYQTKTTIYFKVYKYAQPDLRLLK